MFYVVQYQYQLNDNNKNDIIDYQKYITNINPQNIIYSQECITLNCAAKLFYQHLRYEIYRNNAKVVLSQNTKFDQIHNNLNNLNNLNSKETEQNDFFELL